MEVKKQSKGGSFPQRYILYLISYFLFLISDFSSAFPVSFMIILCMEAGLNRTDGNYFYSGKTDGRQNRNGILGLQILRHNGDRGD